MPTIAHYSESLAPAQAMTATGACGPEDLKNLPSPPPGDCALMLLQRVLCGRGLVPGEILDTDLNGLPASEDFPALAQAAPLIADALDRPILVIGDYDADGICGTATTILALRSIGARDTSFRLPNRFSGGYGLSEELMQEIVRDPPWLLIAVDHGTNSPEQTESLLRQGVRVLVIDHHQPGKSYEPQKHENFCIVNPHLPGCQWSDKDLCATAVAFCTLAVARNHLVGQGRLQDLDENKPGRWLDMVALATIGDQMPMNKTNRILVEQGLRRIRAGRSREGIRHLLRKLEIAEQKVFSRQLSHTLVPRLNAAGRVRSADVAVACLLAESLSEAHASAQELIDLNRQRKEIEKAMALEIDRQTEDLPQSAGLVCLAHPEWNIGVVGIGAARLANRLNRPAMVFAPHPERDEWVGSGRVSDPSENILAQMHAIAERDPDIFVNYGGHNQAVGATIKRKNFEKFKVLAAELLPSIPDEKSALLLTDGELSSEEISLENAEWLLEAVVWGKALPLPRFDGVFDVLRLWRLSNNHIRLELGMPGHDRRIQAIRFYCKAPLPEVGQKIRAVYELSSHHFRGSHNLQLIVQYWELL